MIRAMAYFFTVIITFFSSAGILRNGAENWALDIPVYEGGRICDEVYLDGSGILSDAEGPTGKESPCKANLVMMNFLSFHLSGKVFIPEG